MHEISPLVKKHGDRRILETPFNPVFRFLAACCCFATKNISARAGCTSRRVRIRVAQKSKPLPNYQQMALKSAKEAGFFHGIVA